MRITGYLRGFAAAAVLVAVLLLALPALTGDRPQPVSPLFVPAAAAPIPAVTVEWGQPALPPSARAVLPGTRRLESTAPPAYIGAQPAPGVSAAAAVVLDAGSGELLFAKNPHVAMAPASLTKIATAVVAVELGDLYDWVVVDESVDGREMRGSSVMGLEPGDRFRLRDLLYGLMLPSGNDAALAIARHISEDDGAFIAQMNAMMRRLGLHNTTFVDPHGLGGGGLDAYYSARPGYLGAPAPEEGVAHVATAYDLAVLARYALSIPELERIVATKQWKAYGTRTIEMWNSNSFLYWYEGADGLKNGFTEAAGRAIAASVTRDGHRVIVVLLQAPTRDTDAEHLFDWVFSQFCWPGDASCEADED
jgi:D-alanyl-D-alanine carboxypeptidase (penicillin-binding protein 5/6)